MAESPAPKEAKRPDDRVGASGGAGRSGESRGKSSGTSGGPKLSNARRREARRQMPDRYAELWTWVAWFRHRQVVMAALFVVLFTLVGGLLAHSSRSGPKHYAGEVLSEAKVTRVNFLSVDDTLTAREREAARAAVRPLYRTNARHFDELRETLINLLALADRPFEEVNPGLTEQMSLDAEAHAVLRGYNHGSLPAARSDEEAPDPASSGLSSQAGDSADRAASGPEEPTVRGTVRDWNDLVDRVLAGYFRRPILSLQQWQQEEVRGRSQIRVVDPFLRALDPAQPAAAERDVYRGTLLHAEQEGPLAEWIAEVVLPAPEALQPTFERVLGSRPQATYVRDEAGTERRRQEAAATVKPVDSPFFAGDLLLPAGTSLGPAELRLLDAEQAAFEAQRTLGQRVAEPLGVIGIVGLLALVPWLYLFQGSSRIVRNPVRGLTFTALMLLGQAITVLLAGVWPQALYGSGTFGTVMVVMILSVVYDRPFAIVAGTVHALLVTLSLDSGLPLLLVTLTGIAAAALQLREVRTRSKLVVVGAVSGLVMAGCALLVQAVDPPATLDGEGLSRLGMDLVAPLTSGFAAGLLIQGLLPVVEGVFRISTAMTLKDLNDNSRPLLQRLAREAPGTYQHSLRIADMAEAAADAVGGDGLLARTGAMYHDIGKIHKPRYFVENQGGGDNAHDKLSPAMSVLIIVNHVKDGATMAREYNLPRQIVDFIESHHGTTLVEYFFHAALGKAEEKKMRARDCGGREKTVATAGGSEPNEFQFRYPGPKPRTREAAILLLCDGIEAAARSLDEPTPARLQQLVHTMAMKRLTDGQFDHCNLTFRELSIIEQAITKTLCAIHHSRIKYPAGEKEAVEETPTPANAPSPSPALAAAS